MTKMRLRFAPSPTGALHIGGVRTAMYNYFLAKKMGGTFVLRIEDTDQTRYIAGAENYIQEALDWMGITPDEGPKQGGEYGPYRQSERKHLYRQYADELVASGHAYYAFDTSDELNAKRSSFEANSETFTYNSATRNGMHNSLVLSSEETAQLLENKTPYVIRFKMPEEEVLSFCDIVRGDMQVDAALLDDKVLFKSDGMPTYHLANIVDDHLMKITHVIRGEEWLPSLPLHVMLYRAFGWESPEFAHLPLILKPNPASYITKKTKGAFTDQFVEGFLEGHEMFKEDKSKVLTTIQQLLQDVKGIQDKLKLRDKDSKIQKAVKIYLKGVLFGKLSKRDGDRLGIPVFPLDWYDKKTGDYFKGFKSFGFLPEASLNFLAFLGWNPGNDEEIFDIEGLCTHFALEQINKSGARFDFNKAKWYNKQYIMASSNDYLLSLVKDELKAFNKHISDDYLIALIGMLKDRVNFLPELAIQSKPYLDEKYETDQGTLEKKWQPEFKSKFVNLKEGLQKLDVFSKESINEFLEAFMENENIGMGQFLPLLRIALIGQMHGPAVDDMLVLLGKEKVDNRLTRFLGQTESLI